MDMQVHPACPESAAGRFDTWIDSAVNKIGQAMRRTGKKAFSRPFYLSRRSMEEARKAFASLSADTPHAYRRRDGTALVSMQNRWRLCRSPMRCERLEAFQHCGSGGIGAVVAVAFKRCVWCANGRR